MNKNKAFTSNHQLGFSLIEILIVVSIIGILASIAVPAYNGYIIKGKRSEGRAAIMDAAARQERFYSDCNQYGNIGNANDCTGPTVNINATSESGEYNVTVALGANNQSFTLTATPTFTDTKCTTLTYTSAGVKDFTGPGPIGICW